ncbi:MAG: cytochrome b/b6 domain-containing protein [Magnetococcales bacterium]|nr:cytochrome b/b6 domain-containing protein [Magnetococcales bacterium]MBF0322242.1 cytochrome b/b6 domain-containing protein [Magnetococcales bacterium]
MTTRKALLYTRYERFWHWSQAILMIGLMVTGLNASSQIVVMDFALAAHWHIIFARTLIWLWIFTIFWFLVTGEWQQYIPTRHKMRAMVHYYSKGIFNPTQHRHPFRTTPRLKHNPLQRFTYLLLNVLLTPTIWGTGLLYMYYFQWEQTGLGFLSLRVIAGIHEAMAYLLLSFLILHVYMSFTGRPVTAQIKAMLTGYAEIHKEDMDMMGQFQILMVDDDVDFSHLVRAWLSNARRNPEEFMLPAGLSVNCVVDLASAFYSLRRDNYDLILLDLNLPDSQGLDTFLRFHDSFSDVPILVLTGLEESSLGSQAVHEGAQDFLGKSELNAKKLARAIRFASERHQYSHTHAQQLE